MPKETRKRKPKFSPQELDALVNGVERKKDIIFCKFTDTLTNDKKTKAWQQIADAINSVSQTSRTVDEVSEKKWTD